MRWRRMVMEAESPEEYGYDKIKSNLAESSLRDRRLSELGVEIDDLVLLYGDHRGLPALRALIAAEAGLGPEDVILTAGAALALFLVSITQLRPDNHLVVVRPNYATNLETPFAIGCGLSPIDLDLAGGFRVDPARIAAAIRPETRVISVTTPHNPTGVEIDDATLTALIDIAARHGCYLLVDETYREMADRPPPPAASRAPHVISVSSVSKTYGLPGIRLGWVMCQDQRLQEQLLMAKEQIVLTGSVLDETIALRVLERKSLLLPTIRSFITAQRQRVADWLASEPRLTWVRPTGGVVGFPKVVDPDVDMERFYRSLLVQGIFVGPGHWFDQDPRHFRIGWGWPTPEELEVGLQGISAALDAAKP